MIVHRSAMMDNETAVIAVAHCILPINQHESDSAAAALKKGLLSPAEYIQDWRTDELPRLLHESARELEEAQSRLERAKQLLARIRRYKWTLEYETFKQVYSFLPMVVVLLPGDIFVGRLPDPCETAH